ncbi:MAG TPA: hypothetical protein VH541_05930 [Gaiellaceae bacterium]|jgi:hypothetical protein
MTDELITRLAAANPVPHDGPLHVPEPVRARTSWKIALSAIVVIAALALAGIAIADGLGIFNGISSVQHPQTTGDEIDPATKAYVERTGCTQPNGQPCAPMISGLKFDTARHLGQLPDGQNIYVIGCGEADLCTVVGPPDARFDDHSPLSKAHPSTIDTYLNDSSGARHWVTFGVALDGATSVTFIPKETADGAPTGRQVTVPVQNNFWIYEGPPGQDLDNAPDPLQSVTVHFADGTSVTMPATGPNCAAC